MNTVKFNKLNKLFTEKSLNQNFALKYKNFKCSVLKYASELNNITQNKVSGLSLTTSI